MTDLSQPLGYRDGDERRHEVLVRRTAEGDWQVLDTCGEHKRVVGEALSVGATVKTADRKHFEYERRKAEAALDQAQREHDNKAAEIENDLAAVQRRAEAEEERWNRLKERLETELRKAAR